MVVVTIATRNSDQWNLYYITKFKLIRIKLTAYEYISIKFSTSLWLRSSAKIRHALRDPFYDTGTLYFCMTDALVLTIIAY